MSVKKTEKPGMDGKLGPETSDKGISKMNQLFEDADFPPRQLKILWYPSPNVLYLKVQRLIFSSKMQISLPDDPCSGIPIPCAVFERLGDSSFLYECPKAGG